MNPFCPQNTPLYPQNNPLPPFSHFIGRERLGPIPGQAMQMPQQNIQPPILPVQTQLVNNKNLPREAEPPKIMRIPEKFQKSCDTLEKIKERYRTSIRRDMAEKVYSSKKVADGIYQHIVFGNYLTTPVQAVKLQAFNIQIKNNGFTENDKKEFREHLKIDFIYTETIRFACTNSTFFHLHDNHIKIKDDCIKIKIPECYIPISEPPKPFQLLREDGNFDREELLLPAIKKISVSYIAKGNQFFHTIPAFFISYSEKLRTNESKWLSNTNCIDALFRNSNMFISKFRNLNYYQPYILPIIAAEIKEKSDIVSSNKRKSPFTDANPLKKRIVEYKIDLKSYYPSIIPGSVKIDANCIMSLKVEENIESLNEKDDDRTPKNSILKSTPAIESNVQTDMNIGNTNDGSIEPSFDLSYLDDMAPNDATSSEFTKFYTNQSTNGGTDFEDYF